MTFKSEHIYHTHYKTFKFYNLATSLTFLTKRGLGSFQGGPEIISKAGGGLGLQKAQNLARTSQIRSCRTNKFLLTFKKGYFLKNENLPRCSTLYSNQDSSDNIQKNQLPPIQNHIAKLKLHHADQALNDENDKPNNHK